MTRSHDPSECCAVCARGLTPGELAHYGDLCEACTRAANARVEAWLAGRDDPLLDALAAHGNGE